MIALHRLGERVAESDLGRVVIDVGTGAAAVECGVRIGLGRHDRSVDVVADVRKVEAGVHDGLERVIGRVGVLVEIVVEVGLEVATPEVRSYRF